MSRRHLQWAAFADIYDLEFATDHDVPFYLAAARRRPPLLELACGTGRLAIPIARAGVPVVALDASAEMLAIARRKAGDLPGVRWVEGLMQTFDLPERFGTIALAFSSFFVLDSETTQRAVLANIRRHLRPDGQLLMDMITPGDVSFGQPGDRPPPMRLDETLHDAATGRRYELWQATHHDPETQRWYTTREIRTRGPDDALVEAARRCALDGRFVRPEQFVTMLHEAGLEGVSVHGDFVGGAFDWHSPRMVWTIRRRESTEPAHDPPVKTTTEG